MKHLKSHADEKGLKFLSSPFSLEAVEILKEVDIYAWKIASGEVNNEQMMDSIAETGKEIYLSTGMSTIKEIDKAVKKFKKIISYCASMYFNVSTPAEKIGLNLLKYFKRDINVMLVYLITQELYTLQYLLLR